MTIDERLEALTQSVELLTHDIRDLQKMQEQTARATEKREAAADKRQARVDALHADMMLAIARLANTAEAHNGQLADHEERIDNLENR